MQEGIIDAPTESAAVDALHDRGLVVTALVPTQKGIFAGGDLAQLLNRPKTKDVVIFTRQLSTLIEADVPLAEGMRTLAHQTDNPAFSHIINEISEKLEGGTSLSSAFAEYPKPGEVQYLLVPSKLVSLPATHSQPYSSEPRIPCHKLLS